VINGKSSLPAAITLEYADEDYYIAITPITAACRKAFPTSFIIFLSPLEAGYHISLPPDLRRDRFRRLLLPDVSFIGEVHFCVVGDSQDQLPLIDQYDRYKLVADRIALSRILLYAALWRSGE
jgi:hypothetical protein